MRVKVETPLETSSFSSRFQPLPSKGHGSEFRRCSDVSVRSLSDLLQQNGSRMVGVQRLDDSRLVKQRGIGYRRPESPPEAFW